MTKVKNLNGTTPHTCKCGSWLAHWEAYSGKKAYRCSVFGCSESDLVGAHVKIVNGTNHWYIVPFCRGHNNSNDELTIKMDTTLVSANVQETCG